MTEVRIDTAVADVEAARLEDPSPRAHAVRDRRKVYGVELPLRFGA